MNQCIDKKTKIYCECSAPFESPFDSLYVPGSTSAACQSKCVLRPFWQKPHWSEYSEINWTNLLVLLVLICLIETAANRF